MTLDELIAYHKNWEAKDIEKLRLQLSPQSPEDVMKLHGVKSYKSLDSGIAIRKGGQWRYWEFNGKFYIFTGSTRHLDK